MPGAFELPIAAMALAKTRRYLCVIALGCVIRGETPHFDFVASEAASGLQLAGLETGIPVSFGVLTCETKEQAEARVGKGAEAVRTALEMADLFSQLGAAAAAAAALLGYTGRADVENLCDLREETELRPQPEPLDGGDEAPLQPESPARPRPPEGQGDARLRLHALPQGRQGHQSHHLASGARGCVRLPKWRARHGRRRQYRARASSPAGRYSRSNATAAGSTTSTCTRFPTGTRARTSRSRCGRRSISCKRRPRRDLPTLANELTRAALMGARGNSGVIFSQILRGFAEVVAEAEQLDAPTLARAFRGASDAAYAAVTKPVEGTMLTVIREMAEEAEAHVDGTPRELLAAVVLRGADAVERTPELLDVLRNAGVVDAGGAGLLEIVRGIAAALAGEPIPEAPDEEELSVEAVHQELSRVPLLHGVRRRGQGLDREALQAKLEPLGDSLLVVGDATAVKVHVHTDDPGAALAHRDGRRDARAGRDREHAQADGAARGASASRRARCAACAVRGRRGRRGRRQPRAVRELRRDARSSRVGSR